MTTKVDPRTVRVNKFYLKYSITHIYVTLCNPGKTTPQSNAGSILLHYTNIMIMCHAYLERLEQC